MEWITVVGILLLMFCVIWFVVETKNDFSKNREIVDEYFTKKRKTKFYKKARK